MSPPTNYRPRRKKKKMKESEFNDGDLISKLPDSLLHHIFSFLDMKFVIQTSILSRRWRDLWISQPILNFDERVYNPCQDDFYVTKYKKKEKFKCFMDFVERALFFHGASKIHTIHLSCSYKKHASCSTVPLDEWMPLLDRRKIEVIDLQIDMSKAPEYSSLQLPQCLFRCRSLTTLKLDFGPKVDENFYLLPDCGFRSPLPSLKTLHLRSFRLDDGIQDFLWKCPVLENLVISNCSLGYDELYIQHWQLKNLVIDTIDQCRIKVIAPNLESFSCRADPIIDYHFENIKSLLKADINTDLATDYYFKNRRISIDSQNMMECLRGLSNVRSLMLSAWLLEIAIQFPADIGTLPMEPLKPFCNLRLLTLRTSLSKCQIRATIYLLEKCPNLETLVVKMTKPPLGERVDEVQVNTGKEKDCWEAELAPLCKISHLKVVEIWDVEATKTEFEFVKFLLMTAVVLEKVIVYPCKTQSPSNNRELKRFGEKLTTLSGISSRIMILLL